MGQGILWSHIDPNSIFGGCKNLNNAVSCLCELPHYIVHLFEDQKFNPTGRYFVKLYIQGVWRYIYVDDWVRVNNTTIKGLQSKHVG